MEGTPNPIPNLESEPKLDSVWFDKYTGAISTKGVESQNAEKKTQAKEDKEKFLAGEIDTPLIDTREINLEKLAEKETTLLALKKEIESNEPRDAIRYAYRWRINERIAKLRITRATATGDMRRYARYTDFVFGKPDKEIFDDALFAVHEIVMRHLHSEDPEEAAAAEHLYQSLELEKVGAARPIEPPKPEVFEQVKDKTKKDYEAYKVTPPEEESLKSSALAEMFGQALATMNAEGFTVKIDEKTTRAGLKIDQEKREVNVPAKFVTTLNRAKELLNHELNHVKRRLEGERSSLMLLANGLDRYDQGEEGLGTLQEEAFHDGFKDFSRLDYFLASSLAYGSDGNPRNFRQLFEILKSYYTLFFIEDGTAPEKIPAKATKRAWSRSVNVFKGTDMKTPGACHTRGMIYRTGNIAVWDLISKDGREMTKFTLGEYNKGKYDPTNKRHLWILTQLGISDEDLAEIT